MNSSENTYPLPDIKTKRNKNVIKILMLEDNVHDYELIYLYLKSSALNVESLLVTTKEEYIHKLQHEKFDVILADHSMPDFNSFDALRIRNKIRFDVPFILVSGTLPEEYASTIIQEGANDYILKDKPHRLITAITEALKNQKIIAEKLIADQELIKANETLKLVSQATGDAMWDYNIKENFVKWGDGFERLFGYKTNEMASDVSGWAKHIHPEDYKRVYSSLTKVLVSKTKTLWQEEYRYLKSDGTYAGVTDKGIVLRSQDGVAYRMVGAMQDVTHVRKMEMEILEQQLQMQKHDTEIVIQAQEEERKHLGKELHDNINQLLAFSKMMIDTGRKESGYNNEYIEKGFKGISTAIEEVRKLSHRMVPPGFLNGKSFIEAVNNLVEDVHMLDTLSISVNIPSMDKLKLMDENLKVTFYRIIQEQLNNILKYANATKASITVKVIKNRYKLIITDNGVGFNPHKNPKGIGLRNIESRVSVYSGSMKIITAPGKGCQIIVRIPDK